MQGTPVAATWRRRGAPAGTEWALAACRAFWDPQRGGSATPLGRPAFGGQFGGHKIPARRTKFGNLPRGSPCEVTKHFFLKKPLAARRGASSTAPCPASWCQPSSPDPRRWVHRWTSIVAIQPYKNSSIRDLWQYPGGSMRGGQHWRRVGFGVGCKRMCMALWMKKRTLGSWDCVEKMTELSELRTGRGQGPGPVRRDGLHVEVGLHRRRGGDLVAVDVVPGLGGRGPTHGDLQDFNGGVAPPNCRQRLVLVHNCCDPTVGRRQMSVGFGGRLGGVYGKAVHWTTVRFQSLSSVRMLPCSPSEVH